MPEKPDTSAGISWPMRIRTILPGLTILAAPVNARYGTNGDPVADTPERAAMALPALLAELAAGHGPHAMFAGALKAVGPVWDRLTAMAGAGSIGLTVIVAWERALLERSAAADADGYLAAFMSAAQRKRLRQKQRALAGEAPLSLRIIADAPEIDTAYATFRRLEAAGWKGRNGTALDQDAEGRACIGETLAARATVGEAFVAMLEAGDRTIAAGLFLRTGGEVLFWKTTYDETLAKHSPGVVFDAMLTGWLYAQPWFERLDAGHDDSVDPATLIWKQRRKMANVVIDLKPGSIRGRMVVAVLKARQTIRAWRTRLQAAK